MKPSAGLVIACTRLDAAMTDMIAVAAGWYDIRTALITVHHQQFSSKVDTLKAILDARTAALGQLPDGLNDTINRAKNIYDFRSTLVHAAWVVGEKGMSPITERITARGKLVKSRAHQPTHKIREYAQKADEIVAEFEALRDRL